MRNSHLTAGVLAVFFSMGPVAAGWAQMTENASNPTQSKPASTTTSLVPSEPMSAPIGATPSSGQIQTVSYDNKILWFNVGKHIAKTIVIEPGNGEVGLDGLGNRDKVNLTLVNPSATPLQFETTERKGNQTVSVVPPHTQQLLVFKPNSSGQVKFFVMQQPDNAVASNQDYFTQQTAAVATAQQTAIRSDLDQQTAMMRQAQDQQTSQQEAVREAIGPHGQANQVEHRSSAVRGYW